MYVPVRKNRAPKGALRRIRIELVELQDWLSQIAPSAKRCIKTGARSPTGSRSIGGVRKHQAPKGAFRPILNTNLVNQSVTRQKAPSAKRCIKAAMGMRNSR